MCSAKILGLCALRLVFQMLHREKVLRSASVKRLKKCRAIGGDVPTQTSLLVENRYQYAILILLQGTFLLTQIILPVRNIDSHQEIEKESEDKQACYNKQAAPYQPDQALLLFACRGVVHLFLPVHRVHVASAFMCHGHSSSLSTGWRLLGAR